MKKVLSDKLLLPLNLSLLTSALPPVLSACRFPTLEAKLPVLMEIPKEENWKPIDLAMTVATVPSTAKVTLMMPLGAPTSEEVVETQVVILAYLEQLVLFDSKSCSDGPPPSQYLPSYSSYHWMDYFGLFDLAVCPCLFVLMMVVVW
eukprot:Protomagalhaensia_sp_Gyna_25__3340@NODE_3017_length_771_cov_7_359290_g2519_i0_p2_GENE_NODE_3017_length_771_cov_7_359290_g2519_i0NODE_3017_length_771_cov_7_359290_g2519_i0_p2_ORF_typecomplete_len147_score21_36TrkA_TMD/PF18613_1/7_9e03TrkA_TMD/PF18613_1/0_43_NODE_3017_length_771_cov_7_359290_g2519_i0271711